MSQKNPHLQTLQTELSRWFPSRREQKFNGFQVHHLLVGGCFNPSEKYAHQIGPFPQVRRGENKKYLKPPPSLTLLNQRFGAPRSQVKSAKKNLGNLPSFKSFIPTKILQHVGVCHSVMLVH